MNVGSILTRTAARRPGATAVVYGEKRVSYGELNARANRLADALRAGGLASGDRIAILQHNGPALLETLFAAFKAGAVAVPINARLHPREYQYIIDHSGARAVLYSATFAEGVASIRDGLPSVERLICIEGGDPAGEAYEAVLAEGRPEDADLDLAPDALCWLFYTSGTTGRPKGAMVTHGNLQFMTDRYFEEVYHPRSDEMVLHAGPLTHGSGLWAIPLTAAGCVQVINDSPRFDPDYVFGLIERHRISKIVFIAPTMITMLLRAPSIDRYDLSSLRFIGYGGSNMLVEDCKRAVQQWGSILCQIYGQGECPMTISMLAPEDHRLSDDPAVERRLASAGRVRGGIEVAVLDEADRPLPAGEVGEVCLRGPVVMRGYWNDADATAEVFKNEWYHTGDLGRLDRDGYLYLLDRKKELIISGGANIYPREVEEVLLLHPDVIEVAVIAVPDRLWGESALALVRTKPGITVAEAELIELCRQHMAGYKKPRAFRFVEDLPKNAYGKILKRELRAVYADTFAEVAS